MIPQFSFLDPLLPELLVQFGSFYVHWVHLLCPQGGLSLQRSTLQRNLAELRVKGIHSLSSAESGAPDRAAQWRELADYRTKTATSACELKKEWRAAVRRVVSPRTSGSSISELRIHRAGLLLSTPGL